MDAGNQSRTSENILQIQFMVLFAGLLRRVVDECTDVSGEVYTELLGVSSRPPVALTGLISSNLLT